MPIVSVRAWLCCRLVVVKCSGCGRGVRLVLSCIVGDYGFVIWGRVVCVIWLFFGVMVLVLG